MSKKVKKEDVVEATEVEVMEVENTTKEEVKEETTAPQKSVVFEAAKDEVSIENSPAIMLAPTWEEKLAIASDMIDGGIVPSSFANDPGAVISAVEMGMELGLGAWASLNNIVVIQGKATLTLNAMLSLARSKGVLIKVIKDYELVPIKRKTKEGIKEGADRATTVVITRGEDIHSPSGVLLESRVSDYTYTKYWAEAVKADLTSKDNWQRMPRLMLRARAITEALRLYAADILLGMYESTEIADGLKDGTTIELNSNDVEQIN